MNNELQNSNVEPVEVTDISPHNKALYEAGKKMLVESVDVSREFCKYMTTTSIGAIPIYIALLKLILPKDYSLQSYDELMFLIPPILFLLSSIIFVIGYFPLKGNFSLDLPAEIERERTATINRRYKYSVFAFSLFCIGITISIWVLTQKFIT